MFDEGMWCYAVNGDLVEMGAKEGTLLLLLIENKNRVVTYDEISKIIYDCECDEFIIGCIRQLRKNIYKKTQNTIKIYTKKNVGYMLKG